MNAVLPSKMSLHGLVVANPVRYLGNARAGSPYRAFSEGMKVQVADDTIFDTDVFGTCDKADLRTKQIFKSPIATFQSRTLDVADARHSPRHGCVLRGNRAPSDALLGHARQTLWH